MNFRTTILLLVVLIAAAAVYFVTSSREPGKDDVTSDVSDDVAGKPLIEVAPTNVNKVSITPAGGERLVLERSGPSEWRLLEPVNAPAEAFRAEELVRQVAGLTSRDSIDPKDKGLDAPRYVVELTGRDNKTTRVTIGNRSPVGDMLYVRLDGAGDQAQIVSSSILAELSKSAREFRKTRVVNVPADAVSMITITQADKTIRLEKGGVENKWQIVEPTSMPGDAGQVSALLSAVNGLDAVEFIDETASSAGIYGLTKPALTVSLSTAPPQTQPAATTTRPAGDETVVKFGRPDVEKKNVYTMASASGPVVTVAATSLDAFKKTPLDLRDRDVIDLIPDAVGKVAIVTDKAATTQPIAKPAESKQVVLERRSEVVAPAGPPAPTTGSSTQPTTAPATQPAEPETSWMIASENNANADDEKVETILNAMRPLKAVKFLESFPTTQAVPAAVYTVKISTRAWGEEPAKDYELKITDPGPSGPLLGQMGELTFEIDRGIVPHLTPDFHAPKEKPAGPAELSIPGLPGIPGLPPG